MPTAHPLTKRRLRREVSANRSGRLVGMQAIPVLREQDYFVTDQRLDGDAPKQLIKVYQYTPNGRIRRSQPRTWVPYIAKSAQKWYPHESVIEYFINRAGQELGLRMNEVDLLRINGQVRFLSKFFLAKGEMLIHGAEICGDYLGDRSFVAEIANDKREARDLLTFSFVREAMHTVFPEHAPTLMDDLVKMLIFDALLGNNDRHFYNWAVIRPVRRNAGPPRLAPIYDSARGMCWNYRESRINEWARMLAGMERYPAYNKYLKGASPRFSLETDKGVNHFDFIRHLCLQEERYLDFAKTLAAAGMEIKVRQLLVTEFGNLLDPERKFVMDCMIQDRFASVRESICKR